MCMAEHKMMRAKVNGGVCVFVCVWVLVQLSVGGILGVFDKSMG